MKKRRTRRFAMVSGTKTFFLALTAILVTVSCTQAKPLLPVNVDDNGVALKGYDPVAYFTEGKPVKGSTERSHEWNGGIWLFSSAEHLSMFRQDPKKYAPQYGGY